MSISGYASVATASSAGFLHLMRPVAASVHHHLVCNGVDVVIVPEPVYLGRKSSYSPPSIPVPLRGPSHSFLPPCVLWSIPLSHSHPLVNLVPSSFFTDCRVT